MNDTNERSVASAGSVDGLGDRLTKHAENAPYWLLHECENEWAASSVALMNEAAKEVGRLSSRNAALEVCERWLQKQVSERDAKIEALRMQLDEYQASENAAKSAAWEEECWNDE